MSERFVGTVRKCDTGNQWCERKDYVCPYACERAVREKADRVIADATGLLAGLPHYAQHKWGMAESSTGLYVKAADVKAALETEQTMHTAWRKRAEEAERDLAAAQAEVIAANTRADAMFRVAEKHEAEAAALRGEAERYRWLRTHYGLHTLREAQKNLLVLLKNKGLGYRGTGMALDVSIDAAIDAARKESGNG